MAHETSIDQTNDIRLAIVAPDGRDGMLQHAQQLVDAKIPFIFDPGQGLPMFNGEELVKFSQQATYIALNEYEAQLFQDKTGLSAKEVSKHVEALIITRGGQGSTI